MSDPLVCDLATQGWAATAALLDQLPPAEAAHWRPQLEELLWEVNDDARLRVPVAQLAQHPGLAEAAQAYQARLLALHVETVKAALAHGVNPEVSAA